MGHQVPPMRLPASCRPRLHAVCAYCRTDPQKSVCVNCGASQQPDPVEDAYAEFTRMAVLLKAHQRFNDWERANPIAQPAPDQR